MAPLDRDALLARLRDRDPASRAALFREADAVRRARVGDAVPLRGLVEISNVCVRRCTYCGLRAPRTGLPRRRMAAAEVIACAQRARELGFGTVVLQAGEDPALSPAFVADLVRRVKDGTGLAVTLSLGEQPADVLDAWRAAGADRYLLRFETSDPALYRRLHPPGPRGPVDRVALLRTLRDLGYEIGSGVMVGLPGQTLASLADDLVLFQALDLDMIGVGPYRPHPDTPLAAAPRGRGPEDADAAPDTVLAVLALARLVRPDARIPSTTALGAAGPGLRADALACGADVVMPNLTPPRYRSRYDVYPGKARAAEVGWAPEAIAQALARLGRRPGRGPGGRRDPLGV